MTVGKRLKFVVKLAVAHVFYWLGVLRLWQFIVLRRKAVVLMYHRVLTSDDRAKTGSHPGIVVDRDAFAVQMGMLRRYFKVLSIAQFAERLEKQAPFEDASCLITFDDGWRDNVTHALPILRQNQLSAVVFLPVNFIGGQRIFWQEHLTHLAVEAVMQVRREPGRRRRLGELLAPVGLDSLLDASAIDPRPMVKEAVRQDKGLAPSLINAALAGLAEELGDRQDVYEQVDGFLDWEHIASMARQGIAFGGHGAEHRILTLVPLDEARDEIRTSRQVLERGVPASVPTFSYPNGNWSPEVAALVEEAGYRLAFTTEPGFVSCDDDRFAIRRVNIHEGLMNSKPMFLARVVGLF
jgi:peptidoglycan/xylan/chitin deacetylase (PgdA/CDA1 family)